MRFSVGHTNKELAIRKVLIQQAYKTLKPFLRFPGWNGFSFLVHAAPPFPLPAALGWAVALVLSCLSICPVVLLLQKGGLFYGQILAKALEIYR